MNIFSLNDSVVLVIDDTSLMRASHKKMLLSLGIKESNIFLAEDGAKGLNKLAQLLKSKGKVDLIICDWDMPKVNGIQVLEMIRKVPSSMGIPFVMITGHTQREDIVTAVKMGVDFYIVKPLRENDFQLKIMNGLLTGFIRQ